MTPDKAPRRWVWQPTHGMIEVLFGNGKASFIPVEAYVAIEVELQRERRKVQKLREQRDSAVRKYEKANLIYDSVDDFEYTLKGKVKRMDSELEAIDKEGEVNNG